MCFQKKSISWLMNITELSFAKSIREYIVDKTR